MIVPAFTCETDGLRTIRRLTCFGPATFVQFQPAHWEELGVTAAQAVERGGIIVHTDELLGAGGEEVAAEGLRGLLKLL